MEKNIWPNPKHRKIIIVTSDEDYLRNEDKFSDNPNVMVYNASVYPNEKMDKAIEERGLLKPGNVLLQDPCDWERYTLLSQDPYESLIPMVINKYMAISQIARVLGAKCFYMLQEEQDDSNTTQS